MLYVSKEFGRWFYSSLSWWKSFSLFNFILFNNCVEIFLLNLM